MSNESDEDIGLCTSKRPKTKLQTLKDVSDADKKQTDNEDDTILTKKRTENVTPIKDNKKAAKRGRESDEESSISSDEETMCKKRVRKDSEEDIRPKKRVSVEARKRREAARSVVEKKKAVLDSDSDCESETQLESYKSCTPSNKSDTKNKSVDMFLKDRLPDSKKKLEVQENCENSVVKNSKICSKKNEDSSSAYNSDSEGNKARKISKNKKTNYKIKKGGHGDSTEDEDISLNALERRSLGVSSNSEDEAGDSSSDLEDKKCANSAKNKMKKTRNSNYENDSNDSGSEVEAASNSDKKISKCVEVDLGKSDSKKVKAKDFDSESTNNTKLPVDSESESKESPLKKRVIADTEKCNKSSEPFASSDAESDDILLAKPDNNKSETIENSSDSDRPLRISKSGTSKKVPFGSKTPFASEKINSHCNKPVKNTKRSSKASRNESSSSWEDSSDEDSSKRKTLHKKFPKESSTNLHSDKFSRSDSSSSEKYLKKTPIKVRKEKESSPSSSYTDNSPLKRSKSAESKVKSKESNTILTSSSDSDEKNFKLLDKDKIKTRKQNEVVKHDTKRKLSLQGICNELNKSSDDSDAPLKVGNVTKSGKKFPLKTEKKGKSESEDESADEQHKHHGKTEKQKVVVSSISDKDSDCDSKKKNVRKDSYSVSKRKNEKKKNKESKQKSSESDVSDSDSDEPLKGKSKSSKKLVEEKSKSSESSSDHASESKSDVAKKNKKEKKTIGKWEVRINSYKKYINAAGIRINNYASFWEGCKNDKQRADKMQKLLEDHGVKGRPSLQKCKKIRKMLERKREIQELDLNNIIEDDGEFKGRYRCRSSRREENKSSTVSDDTMSKEAAEKAAEIKQRFSRIKDLIDSGSSSD